MASIHNTSEPIPSAPRPSTLEMSPRHIASADGEYASHSPAVSNSSSEKSSGTIIVPRDQPNIELVEEEYGPEDARTMSPRRTSEEVTRLGENARQALEQQAKELQESLLQIVERVESVKSEHEKLEGGNKFLQDYIGELMQTSNLTASGAGKGKGKGKSAK